MTAYAYYPDGRLWTKKDARQVVTTLSYDAARRLKSKSYSDGTLTVLYCYDGEEYSAGPCLLPSARALDPGDYPKGRLTGVGTSEGWTNHQQVDAMGRTTKLAQGIEGLGTKVFEYTYASNGAVKSMLYPGGRRLTYTLSNAGRVTGLSGMKDVETRQYAGAMKYGAAGMMLERSLAGGTAKETRAFNWLGQMTGLEVKNGAVARLNLGWTYGDTANNGNVQRHTIMADGSSFTQHFGYDAANRLRMAVEKLSISQDLGAATCSSLQATWPNGESCLRFGYDGFGNAWNEEKRNARGLRFESPNWFLHPVGATARVTNRLQGVVYDAAGNLTQYEPADGNSVAVSMPKDVLRS